MTKSTSSFTRRAGTLIASCLLIGCSDQTRALTENEAPESRRQASAQTLWDSVGGPVSLTVTQFGADGSVTTRKGNGRFESQRKLLEAPRYAMTAASWQNAERTGNTNGREVPIPTFGALQKPATRTAGNGGQFTIPAQRIYAEKVNGKLVEIYLVRESGKRRGTPLGVITRIDNKISEYAEYLRSGSQGFPSRIRTTQVSGDGTIVSQVEMDLADVSLSTRVSLVDQPELRKGFGRLLRGVANLVLPDVLHAQAVEDNPCDGWETTTVTSAAAYATAVSANTIAAAFCAVTLVTCEAFLVTSAASIVAWGVLVWSLNKYDSCQDIHPYCFDGGYMTNGSCAPAGGGGGTSYPGGFGGGGESSGIVSATTGTTQGGIFCNVTTSWWVDGGGYHTEAQTSCYTI